MHRYRRNESFLTPTEQPLGGVERPNLRGKTVLGIVVNPRDKRPVLVVTDGEYVGIRSLLETSLFMRHGNGYYDTTGHGESERAEQLTGMPRAHTPGGVTPRGSGYGTALYTALSLGAHQQDEGDAEIKMNTEGDGICSESEGRSREADTWWEAASKKGLTESEETEGEYEKEEYVELDVSPDDIESCVSSELEEGQTIVYVNKLSVDIETTGPSFIVDKYPYTSAWDHDLVAVELQHESDQGGLTVPVGIRAGSELKWLVEYVIEEPDRFKNTEQTSLLALDVRGLDVQAVNLLSLAYMAAGLDDRAVDALFYRWKHDLDPGAEVRQLGLFSPNAREAGLADVVEARKQANWARLASLP